jgi:hypothetical protein
LAGIRLPRNSGVKLWEIIPHISGVKSALLKRFPGKMFRYLSRNLTPLKRLAKKAQPTGSHRSRMGICSRAGTTGSYFFGDDESKLKEYAWFLENSGLKLILLA